jgi:hypothetical protein
MANFSLNKTVFDKKEYTNVIDTSFSQANIPASPIEDTITPAEFFNLYNTIFYDIPTTGEVNSHEYIVKKSSEYIGISSTNEDVQMLLDEITSLQKELLAANQQLIAMQVSSSVSSSVSSINSSLM